MVDGQHASIVGAPPPDLQRDRAAVAFLDIVGFSALMGADEITTFYRWKSLKEDYVVPELLRLGGRFVKSTGDGLLATFPAAEPALEWAGEVQRGARQRGEGLRMRIALNYGSMIIDVDGDIAGDCVNIAARLEQHAQPGGVIVSGDFVDAFGDTEALDLRPTGPIRLKNIRRQVTAWHVQLDARSFASADPVDPARRLPSIAVMPFESEEAERFFCNGVVDDIIASLSGVQELNVTARSTVMALGPGHHVDPRDLGAALGVDYIVHGVMRHAPERLRLSYEVIDASDGHVVASERSEFEIADLFVVQDQIVEKIIAGVAPEVRRAALVRALRKPPSSFTAYEHMLRALDKVSSLDWGEFREARSHLDAAIAEDPGFANPHAWRARWRTLRIGQGWSDDPAVDFAKAAVDAERAIKLDRRNALALATFGHVRAYMVGDYETAIDFLDRAVAAGPNNAIARILRSGTLSFLGRATEAQSEAEKALRLSPFDEQLFQFYGFLALACYTGDRFAQAGRWAHRSLAENPNYTHSLKTLLVAQAGAGNLEAARQTATWLMEKEPTFRTGRYRTVRAPFQDPARVETLIERFAAAGVPT